MEREKTMRCHDFNDEIQRGAGRAEWRKKDIYRTYLVCLHLDKLDRNILIQGRTDNSQALPTPSSNVPFRRDDDFVDRGDILACIDERCSRPAGRAALVGFGGFG
jgi:hypothetical protein